MRGLDFSLFSDGRPPSEEETPSPEADEIVVFGDFFICGL
jgi:hypothetical protein